MTNRERRDKGMAYITDASVLTEQFKSRILQRSYNRMIPFNIPKAYLLLKLMGLKYGKDTFIDTPFRCDYGKHITVGKNFYANSYCTIIDVAPVKIGDNVMLGPNVQIITAGQAAEYGEITECACRTVSDAVRGTDDEAGLPVFFLHPRRRDADNAGIPALAGKEQHTLMDPPRFCRDLRPDGMDDLLSLRLALGIELVDLLCKLTRSDRILTEHQLHSQLR